VTELLAGQKQQQRPRLADIDQCKGLAIFLVVVGHVKLSATWSGYGALDWLTSTIYQFHMSFFMFLSGLVTWYTYRPVRCWGDYTRYVGYRFRRFFPAYVLFALLISLSKSGLSPYVYVDNVPQNLLVDWARFTVNPLNSSATSLWYIYVLLAYTVIMPPLLWLARNNLAWLLPAALVVHFIPVTNLFSLSRVAEHAFVFVAGGLVAHRYAAFAGHVDRWWWVYVPLFLISCAAWEFLTINPVLIKFITGLISVPALVGLVRRYWLQSRLLAILSKCTFAIYLVNMLAIGAIKAAASKFGLWDQPGGIILAPIMVCGGLFIPVLAKKYLFNKVHWLDKITT